MPYSFAFGLALWLLAAPASRPTTRPASRPATQPASRPAADAPDSYVLGDSIKLGNYRCASPKGWQPATNQELLVAMYRSPDKSAVIRAQVRPKGAIIPEAQPKYAPAVIARLKQDFLKNKTEVIDPPAVQKDPRFFLKIRERIRIKDGKIAAQSHLYIMPGRDLIELTVITTSQIPEQIAATEKLADEMLLSFQPAK